MQAAKKAVENIKETAANIGASAKSGLDKTKATIQEQTEKMGASDQFEKDMATIRKEERCSQAEMEKQLAHMSNAAAKHTALAGESHYTDTGLGTEPTAVVDPSGPGTVTASTNTPATTGPGTAAYTTTGPGTATFNTTGPGTATYTTTGPGTAAFNSTGPGTAALNSTGSQTATYTSTGPGTAAFNSSGPGTAAFNSTGPGTAAYTTTGPRTAAFNSTEPGTAAYNSTGPGYVNVLPSSTESGAATYSSGGPGAGIGSETAAFPAFGQVEANPVTTLPGHGDGPGLGLDNFHGHGQVLTNKAVGSNETYSVNAPTTLGTTSAPPTGPKNY